jgi:hypothetical protein
MSPCVERTTYVGLRGALSSALWCPSTTSATRWQHTRVYTRTHETAEPAVADAHRQLPKIFLPFRLLPPPFFLAHTNPHIHEHTRAHRRSASSFVALHRRNAESKEQGRLHTRSQHPPKHHTMTCSSPDVHKEQQQQQKERKHHFSLNSATIVLFYFFILPIGSTQGDKKR